MQTSAVQNSAELAHFRSSAGGTRRLSALMAALLHRGHCSMAAAALWRRHTMTAAELGGAVLWRRCTMAALNYGGARYGGAVLWRRCTMTVLTMTVWYGAAALWPAYHGPAYDGHCTMRRCTMRRCLWRRCTMAALLMTALRCAMAAAALWRQTHCTMTALHYGSAAAYDGAVL